jgi:hypothetical protein
MDQKKKTPLRNSTLKGGGQKAKLINVAVAEKSTGLGKR